MADPENKAEVPADADPEQEKLIDEENKNEEPKEENKDEAPKEEPPKEEAAAPFVVPNPMETKDDADEYKEKENKPVYSQCCCCICHCSDELTEKEVCCLLIPLKAGITFIAIATVVLIAIQISQQFFLMLNDQVKWWYPFVNIVLYAPTYTGASFFVVWLGKDDISNRGRLFCGCILVVISTSLVAAWTIIYFVWIYKQEYVYYGWGTPESGYLKFQKKYYIFRELLSAIIILVFYSYFICVTTRYRDLLREKRNAADQEEYDKQKSLRQQAEEWLVAKQAEEDQ